MNRVPFLKKRLSVYCEAPLTLSHASKILRVFRAGAAFSYFLYANAKSPALLAVFFSIFIG